MTPAPADPRRRARTADGLVTRALRLPAARTSYDRATVRVPMRDGVQLVAEHLAPATAHPLGTVLVRTPYGRGGPFDALTHRMLAARGYHVLVQSCRGTFGSGGEFEPMADEAADGHDTVAWLREQPWFDGRLATVGGSYLGWTQWALMTDPPPELIASVVVVGPHHFGEVVHGTGAFTLTDFLGWSNLIVHQEEPGAGALLTRLTGRGLSAAVDGLPLDVAAEPLLRGRAPWYRDWVGHPDLDEEYWVPRDASAALDEASSPILLVGGWQDVFLPQTVAQYAHLRERGHDVALTIGPWTHLEVGLNGAATVARETLAWLDQHLAGVSDAARPAPVRVYVTGAGKGWQERASWPPPTTPHERHLQPGGLLGVTATEPEDSPVALFRYEPADPTPTVGGRLLSPPNGVRNQRSLESRPDVSVFTSEPLTHDVEVQGVAVLEVLHSTDNPHADLFVRLSDVGRTSRNVTDAHVRLDPDRDPTQPLRIPLDPCAHRFATGHRLRLLVAGGSHPRFARNPGTGAGPLEETRLEGSTHTLHGGHLTLPVVLEQGQADGSR